MIPRIPPPEASTGAPPDAPGDGAELDWREHFRRAFATVDELLAAVDLEPADFDSELAPMVAAARDFPVRVPRGFVARMRPGDAGDPLLLQVLPLAAEGETPPGFEVDPLAEARVSPVPGLLQKYHGRALLVPTAACAVHCRYCFRRHFPYGEHVRDWRPAVEHLAGDPSVREVILSGGDPLSLSDARLGELVEALSCLPHVERLRLHTRLPVVLPERVGKGLVRALRRGFGTPERRVVVVIHANHARELDSGVGEALERLRAANFTLLNQSVLLRRVNDDVRSLRELSEALFRTGVMPYYLHVLDRVVGAAHFEVGESRARDLVRMLMGEMPGYLVPKLVREIPGEHSKTPMGIL